MSGKPTPPKLATTFNVFQTTAALQTIVAPASNTKGIIVYGAWASNSVGMGTQLTRVMAKSSTPTAANDANANTLAVSGNGLPGSVGQAFPIVLPAGVGLYAQCLVGNVNAGYGVEIELL